jgi:hypothetical protein
MRKIYINQLTTSALMAIILTLLLSANIHAEVVNLTANLDTAQETTALDPATPIVATGNAIMSFDTTTKQLVWNINFSELSGAAIAAHFHGPAGVGQEADVQVDIGTISGLLSPLTGSTVLTNAQESELLSGLWYINIHTALNPPGEIRGQAVVQTASASAIPTLTQWSMIGLMLVLFLLSLFQFRRHS